MLAFLQYSPAWAGTIGRNDFTLRIIKRRDTPWSKAGEEWRDSDDVRLAEWFERCGLFINSTTKVREAVVTVAAENAFHPVKDWLRSVKWDGKQRSTRLLPDFLGAEDTVLNQIAGKNFLVGCVARIEIPGAQNDTCLLLIGKQGGLKSTFCRVICPRDEYFSDHISELGGKDSRLELHGKILIEFAELSRIKGRELERVKAYLTARVDTFRPPYGRAIVDVPRSCSFIATTNDEFSLTDETGNRRFLPVHVGKINIDAVLEQRDQLWAEGFARFRAGGKWHLDSAELVAAAKEEQDKCYQVGVWDGIIEKFLEDPKPRTVSDRAFYSIPGRVLIGEILTEAIGKDVDKWTQQDQNSVARCLVHLGYARKQFRTEGKQRAWFYVRESE